MVPTENNCYVEVMNTIFMTIFWGVLWSCSTSESKTTILNKEDLQTLFNFKKKLYRINGVYSLSNDTIYLPHSATIVFESGSKIMDGVLVGYNSKIRSESSAPIFKNISFTGNFIGTAFSKWFSLEFNKQIDNSFELNSALNLAFLSSIHELKLPHAKVLYVKSDIKNTKALHFLYQGTVEIKSNVCFDLNGSTIICLPNAAKQYNILFSRQSKNITIRNGTICGDLKYHRGKDGEWGYGIELQGVHGFLLEDIVCRDCWGDGINIQVSSNGDGNSNSDVTQNGHCSNGVIRNVKCYNNRRQGMSIEGVIGLKITNSLFSNTSGARPQSGIDLEPYSTDNLVTDVSIKNCQFVNNDYSGILIMGQKGNVRNVEIDNCFFLNNKAYDITMSGKNVNIKNCSQNYFSIKFVGDCDFVKVSNSSLSRVTAQDFSKGHHVRNVVLSYCTLSNVDVPYTDDLSLTDCDLSYNNCKFDFSKKVLHKGPFHFNSNSHNKYSYYGCRFYLGANTLYISESQYFSKCLFFTTNSNRESVNSYLNIKSKLFNECIIK